ncbi:MAG: cytochrome c3 family protein [Calditrichaceae bacterium]
MRTHITHLFILTVIALLAACHPESRHKVLTTFFDGVPGPEAEQSATVDTVLASVPVAGTPASANPVRPKMTVHPVYAEKSCDACHVPEKGNALLDEQPGLCYQCHDDFNDNYEALHGPVGAGFCTECHNPHLSKNEHLLIRNGQELCLFCHQSGDVFKNEAHQDINEVSCLDCHNPHGGEDAYLFR